MKNVNKLLIAAGLLAFSFNASAAVVTYTLTESNDLVDGEDYAVVTIRDSGKYTDTLGNVYNLEDTGDIAFSVSIVDGAFDVSGDNFGLQAFSLNYDPRTITYTDDDGDPLTPDVMVFGSDLVGTPVINDVNPTEWNVTNTNGSISEFGKFDFDLAGDGNSRANPLTFLITAEGDVIDNYTLYFAGHIAGFDLTDCDSGTGDGGCTSAWFAGGGGGDRGLTPPAVPIPAAAWLFGSGLIGLVGVARRNPQV